MKMAQTEQATPFSVIMGQRDALMGDLSDAEIVRRVALVESIKTDLRTVILAAATQAIQSAREEEHTAVNKATLVGQCEGLLKAAQMISHLL